MSERHGARSLMSAPHVATAVFPRGYGAAVVKVAGSVVVWPLALLTTIW